MKFQVQQARSAEAAESAAAARAQAEAAEARRSLALARGELAGAQGLEAELAAAQERARELQQQHEVQPCLSMQDAVAVPCSQCYATIRQKSHVYTFVYVCSV